MELPTYFKDFLQDIRPTKNQNSDAKTGHETLRKRLLADKALSPIIVSTFLQGSYRRATAVRPRGENRSDVDVIVVTTISEDQYTPQQAMNLFVPFLNEHYKDKYEFRGRSIRITLSYVELDMVITSAPSEAEVRMLKSASVTSVETPEDVDDWRLVSSWVPLAERSMPGATARLENARKEAEWKLSPLRIPDREAKKWDDTHPLEQIKWTWAKNRATNKHYINVVKALKWWRRVNYTTPKYPKGYPLEHIIGDNCVDGIRSVAAGVTNALENIVANYRDYAARKETPFLKDRGVPTHNVLRRITGEEFAEFHGQAEEGAKIARRALDATTVRDSALEWRKLFGDKFPAPPDDDDDEGNGSSTKSSGYTIREQSSTIGGGRYA